MRAEGPKERPTTHSSCSTMCSDAESAKAAPNMAQIYITPTSWSVVIRLLYSNLWVLAKCLVILWCAIYGPAVLGVQTHKS